MKYCPRCGMDKPATSEYWYRNNQTIDRLQGYCKSCKSQIHKDYMKDPVTGEKVRKRICEWQKGVGKEKFRITRERYMKSNKYTEWRHKRTEKAKEFAEYYVKTIMQQKEEE